MHQKLHLFVIALVVAAVASSATTAFALHRFSDVPTSHPFHDDIAWLADTKIGQGFEDGTFRPGQPVTRQSMAAFLHRLAENQVVDAATVQGLGPEDLRGDPGPPGITGLEVVQTSMDFGGSWSHVHEVDCPAGKVPLAVGGYHNAANYWVAGQTLLATSGYVRFEGHVGSDISGTSFVWLLCAPGD